MSEPDPTANAEPGPPTPKSEPEAPTPTEADQTGEATSARTRRRAGVAGAAIGDLLVRLEAQIFRSQPTAQLQVTRPDEVTAQTSDGLVVVTVPDPLSDLDTDEPADGA
jgi:hypothetical protein